MRTSDPEILIRELAENARIAGQKPLERRLMELTLWHHANKSRIPLDNLAAKQQFLEKGFWILLEVNALLVERLHEVESSRTKRLWLPRGMVSEDGKRFS